MSAPTSEAPQKPEATKPARPGLVQAVTGVVPPQIAEARIRQCWPTVMDASPGMARLGKKLIRSIVFAPFGWLLMAPLYFKKVGPFGAKRYLLTNQRIVILCGLKMKPRGEVALKDIEDVRIVDGSYEPFYRSGTLEVIAGGKAALLLTGVPEPEAFRLSILNAASAWGTLKLQAVPPASAE